MSTFKVVHEITVVANSPLQAAKTVQRWMDNADTKWMFYVQQEGKNKIIFSVDLGEEPENMAFPIDKYEPSIK